MEFFLFKKVNIMKDSSVLELDFMVVFENSFYL